MKRSFSLDYKEHTKKIFSLSEFQEKKIDGVEAKYLLKKSTSINKGGKQIISL